jgi:hypothetical protein
MRRADSTQRIYTGWVDNRQKGFSGNGGDGSGKGSAETGRDGDDGDAVEDGRVTVRGMGNRREEGCGRYLGCADEGGWRASSESQGSVGSGSAVEEEAQNS